MSRETFHELEHALEHWIAHHRTLMREPVLANRRVAIILWWLVNMTCYKVVTKQFGAGLSTIAMMVWELCLVIELQLLSKMIYLHVPHKVGLPVINLGHTCINDLPPFPSMLEYNVCFVCFNR